MAEWTGPVKLRKMDLRTVKRGTMEGPEKKNQRSTSFVTEFESVLEILGHHLPPVRRRFSWLSIEKSRAAPCAAGPATRIEPNRSLGGGQNKWAKYSPETQR